MSKEVENDLLDDYTQIGAGEPTDSFREGTGKQLIDLSEYYSTTEQDGVNTMVTGAEAFKTGKVSRSDIVALRLPDGYKYDPFPTERNALMGAEGFVATVVEGFKKIIESVIKYIKMGVDWVIAQVSGFFGYRKSARQRAEVAKKLPSLEQEFHNIMKSMGLDSSIYDFDSLTDHLSGDLGRNDQVTILANKVDSDADAMERLAVSIPKFKKIVAQIRRCGNDVTRAAKNFKRVIGDEANRVKADVHLHGDATTRTEVTNLYRVFTEVEMVIAEADFAGSVSDLFRELYGIEFKSSEATAARFKELVADTNNQIVAHTFSFMQGSDREKLQKSMLTIENYYAQIKDEEVNLSDVNWREVGKIIDMSDVDKIKYIAEETGDSSVMTAYTVVAQKIRDFTIGAAKISSELVKLEMKLTNLTQAQLRVRTYLMCLMMDDFDTLIAVNKAAIAAGYKSAVADPNGFPIKSKFVFLNEAGVKTGSEKIAQDLNFVIEADVAGLKTRLNNFAKQIGVRGL